MTKALGLWLDVTGFFCLKHGSDRTYVFVLIDIIIKFQMHSFLRLASRAELGLHPVRRAKVGGAHIKSFVPDPA